MATKQKFNGTINALRMPNLARLTIYSYLDVETLLKSISKLNRSERSLVMSESTNGSNICYKGKRHVFKLGTLLADKCVSHTKDF